MGTEVKNINRLTVNEAKRLVETFKWTLNKYAMESESENGHFIWLYES